MERYRSEARNVNAFVTQVVRYVNGGHYFYVRCMMKDRKHQAAPEEVDRRVLEKYEIARPRWQRKRRYLKEKAGIHYLRFARLYVLMLTKGKHEPFYRDHGDSVCDIRRKALEVFAYSVRYSYSVREKRWRVFVRLTSEELKKLTAHMLRVCVWDSYRDKSRMEREFRRLPYDAYDPVFDQLLSLARKVNRARRKRGFEPIDFACIPKHISVQKVFFEELHCEVA